MQIHIKSDSNGIKINSSKLIYLFYLSNDSIKIFRYDKKFIERLFPNYYDIKEEELYEFRDGYCFVLFRDDLDALDAHQIALELRPKPLK